MGVGTGMARRLLAAVLLAALACGGAHAKLNRYSFPKDFVFGTGSAAYQYEGAYNEGGKGPSIWDKFTHIPGKIKNNDTGDVAEDMYHRYKEDGQLLKDMNLDAFRFSIAWTRILPSELLCSTLKAAFPQPHVRTHAIVRLGDTPRDSRPHPRPRAAAAPPSPPPPSLRHCRRRTCLPLNPHMPSQLSPRRRRPDRCRDICRRSAGPTRGRRMCNTPPGRRHLLPRRRQVPTRGRRMCNTPPGRRHLLPRVRHHGGWGEEGWRRVGRRREAAGRHLAAACRTCSSAAGRRRGEERGEERAERTMADRAGKEKERERRERWLPEWRS